MRRNVPVSRVEPVTGAWNGILSGFFKRCLIYFPIPIYVPFALRIFDYLRMFCQAMVHEKREFSNIAIFILRLLIPGECP